MLRSDLCDYSDAYIVVKGKITITKGVDNDDNSNTHGAELALKNNAPIISCISKINGQLIENAKD